MAAAGSALASGGTLNLVAYSAPQSAYSALIPLWQKTPAGKGWAFAQSYGPSGDQSRKVVAGLPADVVNFATEPDVTRLVKAGLVSSSWNHNAHGGFVNDSVVVFIVRKGNPKHIHTWSDLLKKGVSVVTPNPISSGGARWNILAAYGAQLVQHKSTAQANAYLKSLFKHVPVQPASAREALTDFQNGTGDVVLDYESEAFFAKSHGVSLSYVIPPQTILIQTPIAVRSSSKHLATAQSFVNFLWTTKAQAVFAQHGFRPVVASVLRAYSKQFPHPAHQFTVRLFGGWTSANNTFFSPNGIVAHAEK
jgi:sulfate/thiosulfate transport system substrate-binding protein